MAGTADIRKNSWPGIKKEIDDKNPFAPQAPIRIWFILIPKYDDGRDYLDHLQEMLVAQGIEFRPRTSRESFR